MSELTPNKELEKQLNKYAWVVTAIVLVFVSTMHKMPKFLSGIDFTWLPGTYSALNAVTAILLIVALVFIKKGQVEKHRKTMNLAVICSALFLVGYVLYHLTYEDTKFGDLNNDYVLDEAEMLAIGGIRPYYLGMLITHVILAGVILPFILFTYIRAYTNQFQRHVKMARWVFWVWLYVAVTGPVLYLMIRPYYPWING